jgi:hypothetical protein
MCGGILIPQPRDFLVQSALLELRLVVKLLRLLHLHHRDEKLDVFNLRSKVDQPSLRSIAKQERKRRAVLKQKASDLRVAQSHDVGGTSPPPVQDHHFSLA